MRAEPAGNPAFETVIVSVEERVATITLHRPDALNALSSQVMTELVLAARALDADDSVAVIVLTGSGRAFAAGADIAEMQSKTFSEMHRLDWFSGWDDLARVRKPLVAAVAGFALGGGCELAMMCDIVLAADDARFGQPEVRLGIPPGIGATQRLTRAVGKSLAMELCLTGRMLDAHEALARGLVSRVVPREELLVAATDLARTIASYSISATTLIKDCVNQAFETGLTQGLHYERRSFHAAFATADQAEGMDAFLAKRSPTFTNS